MKLLVVLTHNPFPSRAGSDIVTYNSIKQLSKNHEIYLICRGEGVAKEVLQDFVEEVEFIPTKKLSFFLRAIRYLYSKVACIPIPVRGLSSVEMKIRVKELLDRQEFDAILLFEMWAMQYIHPKYYGKVVANIEDPYSIKLRRMSHLPVWTIWERADLIYQSLLYACYERRLFPRMGRILLLSKKDELEFRERCGYKNLGYVTYGVEKRRIINATFEQRSKGMIIFSGNMYHPPNIDGVIYFLSNVFSYVLQDYPTAVLWIVGANPDLRIREAAANYGDHVVITGKVDDISEYLARATVSICPVRLEIGVQTKILEALSWGTPVVTTSAGNKGIGAHSGRELWVEDEPAKFAARIVDLLNGRSWLQLSEEGRRLVLEQFSWERSASELEQHIQFVKSTAR